MELAILLREKEAQTVAICPFLCLCSEFCDTLSPSVLNSLKESYDQASRRDDVKAIVVTGAQGKFSGGFDISAFGKIQGGNGFVSMEILCDTVTAARKPSKWQWVTMPAYLLLMHN
ncbi:unnamed protein product [Fraxinus pennsylvanica]|uniref:Uncharacterized protein n=1 Tax=Fraxinus pennsylvanica TaxID=56036 RepID=A0AAD2DQ88_9LAMI|nr:unnamed protein product [Fraxinus pennsylvanica]